MSLEEHVGAASGHIRQVSADQRCVVLVLSPDPAQVRRARSFVMAACQGASVEEQVCETAVLLASEVVTNAFLHGRSQTRLCVTASPSSVLVEVGDDNSRHPVVEPADAAALDGRGMALVDLLAAAWGVREEAVGKTVWFTVTAH